MFTLWHASIVLLVYRKRACLQFCVLWIELQVVIATWIFADFWYDFLKDVVYLRVEDVLLWIQRLYVGPEQTSNLDTEWNLIRRRRTLRVRHYWIDPSNLMRYPKWQMAK